MTLVLVILSVITIDIDVHHQAGLLVAYTKVL